MVDLDLILAKSGLIQKHLKRIAAKSNVDLEIFISDIDRQEVISFNLHLAIENCIDIAAHIISEEGFGMPGSASDMFYLLEENSYFGAELAERMVKTIGLRNLIVHEYAKVELDRLYQIVQKDIGDINDFLAAVFKKLGIST